MSQSFSQKRNTANADMLEWRINRKWHNGKSKQVGGSWAVSARSTAGKFRKIFLQAQNTELCDVACRKRKLFALTHLQTNATLSLCGTLYYRITARLYRVETVCDLLPTKFQGPLNSTSGVLLCGLNISLKGAQGLKASFIRGPRAKQQSIMATTSGP